MTKVTMDNLRMDECITMATGRWDNYSEEFCINYSDILTKLIQEAGRFCESHASDLFIDWMEIEKKLHDRSFDGGTYLFGFRQKGVDHSDWVLSNLNDNVTKYYYYYRSILALIVVVENDNIRMYLSKVNL